MTEIQRDERSASAQEIEFAIDESSYPFVSASERVDCRLELAEMLPRGDGEYAEFFTVTNGDPSAVIELARTHESVESRLLSGDENDAFLEFLVSEGCPAVTLAELGALPREVRGDGGTGRIVAEVPRRYDAVSITDAFLERVPEAAFVAKRKRRNSRLRSVERGSVRNCARGSRSDSAKCSRRRSRPGTTIGPAMLGRSGRDRTRDHVADVLRTHSRRRAKTPDDGVRGS